MRTTVEINGRIYDVSYSTDTLMPENKKYVSGVEAWFQCRKGYHRVTSKRILDKIHEKLEREVV